MADGDNLPAQLDMSKSVPIQQAQTAQPTTTPQPPTTGADTPPASLDMSKSVPIPQDRSALENAPGGLLKGAAQTVTGGMNILGHGIEKVTGNPPGSLTGTFQDNMEKPSIVRDLGEGAENLGEWTMGGELTKFGLAGLAKATKIMEMAEKYPIVARAMAIAKDHPVMEKIITEADEGAKAEKEAKAVRTAADIAKSAARAGGEGAAIGGTQGAVKGAAEGDATKEGLAGAAGGAFGGLVGETASELAGEVAKRFGVGTTAVEDATRGARPNKRNYKFADDFLKAAPRMDAEAAISKPKTVEEWADATADARKNLWHNEVEPLVAKHGDVPLSGLALHDYIMNAIPPAMKRNSPEEAAKMEAMAERYFPTKNPDAQYQLQYKKIPIKEAEEDIEHYNALVGSTGYWEKTPDVRAKLLKSNGELAGNMAVGNAIREELYNRLGILEPGSNMRDLKQTYGSLRNIENEIRGQVNVQGRNSATGLKETIGLITGLAHGGPVGAGIAGLPIIEKVANTPARQIGRAVQKAARPGEEGVIAKTVGAGRGAVAGAGAPVASIAAQHAEESMPEKPEAENATPQGGRITFTASDGTVHSIPSSQLSAALAVDPHLVVTNQ